MFASKLTFAYLKLVLLLTIVVSTSANAEIRPPDGPVRSLTTDDLQPRVHDDRFTFEEWAFSVHLDDGTWIYVTYALSHVWFLPPMCLTEVSVVAPGADPVLYGHRDSAKKFKSEGDTLHFGEGQTISGFSGPTADITARSDWHDDVVVQLAVAERFPGFVLGDGWFSVGVDPNARVWSSVFTPYAHVTGTLTRGGVAKKVRGWMVGTHHFYSRLPNRMFAHRQLVGGKVGEHAIFGILWRESGQTSTATGGLLAIVSKGGPQFVGRTPEVSWLKTRTLRGIIAPTMYAIRAREKGKSVTVAGVVSTPKQIFALTDPLGPATTMAVRAVIGDPVTVRGSGQAEIQWEHSETTVRKKGVLFLQTDHADKN